MMPKKLAAVVAEIQAWSPPVGCEPDGVSLAYDTTGRYDKLTVNLVKCCITAKTTITWTTVDLAIIHEHLDRHARVVAEEHGKSHRERGLLPEADSGTLKAAGEDFVARIAKHARRDQ